MPEVKPTTKKGKRAAVKTVMHEFKHGQLHSGSKSGPRVKNRRQAIAIAMKESGQSRGSSRRKRKRGGGDMSVEAFEKRYGNRPL